MFGLFCKKKTHISRADFITLTLSFQQEIVTVLTRDAQQLFQPNVIFEVLKT